MRYSSSSASTSGSAAIRARHLATVLTSQPTWRAISVLECPSCASTAIRARITRRYGTFDERAHRCNFLYSFRGSLTGVACGPGIQARATAPAPYGIPKTTNNFPVENSDEESAMHDAEKANATSLMAKGALRALPERQSPVKRFSKPTSSHQGRADRRDPLADPGRNFGNAVLGHRSG